MLSGPAVCDGVEVLLLVGSEGLAKARAFVEKPHLPPQVKQAIGRRCPCQLYEPL